VSKQYAHLPQSLPGNISIPGYANFDDGRMTTISTNFTSPSSLPQNPRSHFVPNPVGLGQRTASKRETFKRTNRVDASNEDLHDSHQYIEQHRSQQQQHDYNQPSSNFYAPQHTHHPSGPRPNTNHPNVQHQLTHGAQDSRNYSTISTIRPPQTVEPYDVPQPIPIPRRKSLPSIVKIKPGDYKIDETARSSDNLQEKETFIIENGIRKRVTEQAPTYTESGTPIPQATVMTSSSGSPTLARRIILESVTRVDALTSTISGTGGNKRGSMPTLVNVARKRQAAPSKLFFFILKIFCLFFLLGISREEATILGSQRREELRRQRDRDSTAFGRLKTLLQV
jgi:hypothetical protein